MLFTPSPCHKLSHLLGPPPSSSVTYFMDGPLTIKISKITKEKHVFNFCLSRQKHSKTHVNRLKQSWNQKEIQGRKGEGTNSCCAPPHFISWRRH